jgi:hypothetical protein
VDNNGDRGLSRFYTPQKKDEIQKKDERQKETERIRFAIQTDMNLEPQNAKALVGTKGQKNRFYFKPEEFESLDHVGVVPKEKVAKELNQK